MKQVDKKLLDIQFGQAAGVSLYTEGILWHLSPEVSLSEKESLETWESWSRRHLYITWFEGNLCLLCDDSDELGDSVQLAAILRHPDGRTFSAPRSCSSCLRPR